MLMLLMMVVVAFVSIAWGEIALLNSHDPSRKLSPEHRLTPFRTALFMRISTRIRMHISEWMNENRQIGIRFCTESKKIHMPDFIFTSYGTHYFGLSRGTQYYNNTRRNIYENSFCFPFQLSLIYIYAHKCVLCIFYSFILFSFNSAAPLYSKYLFVVVVVFSRLSYLLTYA